MKKINIKNNFGIYLYFFYNMFILNFIKMDVNLESLKGTAFWNINLISDFNLGFLIKQIFFVIIFYYFTKNNKIAISIIFISMCLNILSSFMIIETSNFSLYNIILILNIILSILGLYEYIHVKDY